MTWKLDLQSYRKPQSVIPSCIGDLINNDNMICRLLFIIYGHDHSDVRSVEVRPLTPGSDITGNLSDCGRVSIIVKTYAGAKHEYSWFVKVQPQVHQNSELLSKFNLFQNEIEFYQKIAPELKEFVDEFNNSESQELEFDIPQLIHAEVDQDRAIIILEDLVGAGYRQVKDEQGEKFLSKEKAVLAVESVAKIHAASYALQIKNNIDLGHIHPNLETSGLLWSNDDMASRLSAMKDYYCDILRESKKPDSPILVERFQKTFDSTEKLKKMCAQRSSQDTNNKGIHCLQQGDFHFNNLMFKEEEDGSVKVKIVDWQMTYTGSVGGDITYLLMSSIAPELYEAEEDNIKERYFEKFNSILKSFIAERKRSLVEAMLEKEYNESLPLGFLFSCGNVMNGEREKNVSFAYQLCNEAASKNLI